MPQWYLTLWCNITYWLQHSNPSRIKRIFCNKMNTIKLQVIQQIIFPYQINKTENIKINNIKTNKMSE